VFGRLWELSTHVESVECWSSSGIVVLVVVSVGSGGGSIGSGGVGDDMEEVSLVGYGDFAAGLFWGMNEDGLLS